eukprot:CAMPEP_0169101658 /NCGR_PEP_ID=MMETSP1015-20121227/21751_1 /TAXON_ID=342587 /ORGANISM="Karlodinium micrum, Strain CCMP2283" /LENGTH=260 /DNA_ID=CAMNT_0009162707 /DNA_START=60 /DNA_END=842 /DNA_ORIENTATION=-
MSDGNARILRELGPVWLECMDAQGVFYFNKVTQQSSDTLPAELGGRPAPGNIAVAPPPCFTPPPPQPPLMMQASSQQQFHPQHGPPMQLSASQRHLAMQQQQPVHGMMQQQANPLIGMQQQRPVLAQGMPHQQQPPPQMHPMMGGHQPMYGQQQMPGQQQPMPAQQPPMPGQQPAVEKMIIGEWGVYEDDVGIFYMHMPTGQQYEAPPPALMAAYHQYRVEQDQAHQEQLRQIEIEKKRIDERLHQQTQALHQRYSMGGM